MSVKDLSLAARYEVTKKYAQAYAAAPKKGKSEILDQVVAVTGWNRDHARQQLTARLRQTPGSGPGHRRGDRPTHDQSTPVLL